MAARTLLPLSLRIIALIAFVSGVSSIFQIITAAMQGNVLLDLGALGILACFGLRRLSNAWRIYLLCCTWLGLIIVPLMLIFVLQGAVVKLSFLGFFISGMRPDAAALLCLAFFAYLGWQLSVLTHPEIVRLFRMAEHPNADIVD